MAADDRRALQALLDGLEQHEVEGDVGLTIFDAIDRALAERRREAPRLQVEPMWFESLGRMVSGDELLR